MKVFQQAMKTHHVPFLIAYFIYRDKSKFCILSSGLRFSAYMLSPPPLSQQKNKIFPVTLSAICCQRPNFYKIIEKLTSSSKKRKIGQHTILTATIITSLAINIILDVNTSLSRLIFMIFPFHIHLLPVKGRSIS